MQADFSLDYDVVTVERSQKLYLMARFEAGDGPDDTLRRPLNLSLVIDRSGSMAGDKIDYIRQAAQFLVQHLGIDDLFSIVLYNDKVETLLQPEHVSNKDSVAQLLDKIRVRGTTNLSGGWLEGCRHVSQNVSDAKLNRVILMSDGLANRGVTDETTLVNMATQKRNEKVTTTTMGLGKDFNEDLMMEMANAGGGAFYFIESPEVAPEIFKEELTGLLSVIGQNLMISIETENHVTSLKQLNAYSVTTANNVTTFQLGDIFAHEVKTLVLELNIPAIATIGETQIATLRFDYDEIKGAVSTHHTIELPVKVNVQADDASAQLNEDVEQSVLLLQAANARREAVKSADQGDYKLASKLLRDVAQSIDESQVINDQLREEQSSLLEQASKMEKSSYSDYSRKTMSTQALFTMTDRHDETVMLRRREQQRNNKSKNSKRDTVEQEISNIESNNTVIPKAKIVTPDTVEYNDKSYVIGDEIIRIGRSEHNEIVLDQKGVSRFHAQIKRVDETVIFEDLGSTNGSTVNGTYVGDAVQLNVGDVVNIGDVKFVFSKDNN